MFGNLTGWIISAVIAAGLGGLLFFVAAPPSITDPTNSPKLAIAYKELALPVVIDTIVPEGKKDGDAGELYRKAIEDYQNNIALYEKFDNDKMNVQESTLGGIALILDARDCRNCKLFSSDLSTIVNYDNEKPPLDALNKLGTDCCTYALLYTRATYNPKLQPERAVQLWEAALILGYHLYEERACWSEYVVGHGLMQMAAGGLANYYRENKETDKADKIKAFADAEGEQATKVLEADKIIGSPDENFAGGFAGDIYKIAESATADKMFRAEAVKHIGYYRFNSLSRGDQLAANRVLKVMADDPGLAPNIKAAATAARDLTSDKYHIVG